MSVDPAMKGRQSWFQKVDRHIADRRGGMPSGMGPALDTQQPLRANVTETHALGETKEVRIEGTDQLVDAYNGVAETLSATAKVLIVWTTGNESSEEEHRGQWEIVSKLEPTPNGYPRGSQDCGCTKGAIGTSFHECEDCGCINVARYSTFPTFWILWSGRSPFAWEEASGSKDWFYDPSIEGAEETFCVWRTDSFDGPTYTFEEEEVHDVYHWECDYHAGTVTLVLEGEAKDPAYVIKVVYCFDESPCSEMCVHAWSFKIHKHTNISYSLTFATLFLPGTNFSSGNQGCKLCVSPHDNITYGDPCDNGNANRLNKGSVLITVPEFDGTGYNFGLGDEKRADDDGSEWLDYSVKDKRNRVWSGGSETCPGTYSRFYGCSSMDYCDYYVRALNSGCRFYVQRYEDDSWSASYRSFGGDCTLGTDVTIEVNCSGESSVTIDVYFTTLVTDIPGEDPALKAGLRYQVVLTDPEEDTDYELELFSSSGTGITVGATPPETITIRFSDLPEPNNSGDAGDECAPPEPPPDPCDPPSIYFKVTKTDGSIVVTGPFTEGDVPWEPAEGCPPCDPPDTSAVEECLGEGVTVTVNGCGTVMTEEDCPESCSGVAVYYKTVVEDQGVLLYSDCVDNDCETDDCGPDSAEFTAWVEGASVGDVEEFPCACGGNAAGGTGPKSWYVGDGVGGWTLVYASPDCASPTPPGGASADPYTPVEGGC